ncbi:MAG: hypothetical protein ACI9P7_000622 [Candidatus Azotimanducaceae bacterium]
MVLLKYSSTLAALSLPREINEEAGLQAASPAFEITRLLQRFGIGLCWLKAFAALLVASAALSIFAALYASLKARRLDLAVLRCLGATRWELFLVLFVEGLVLTIAGIFGWPGICLRRTTTHWNLAQPKSEYRVDRRDMGTKRIWFDRWNTCSRLCSSHPASPTSFLN